MIFMAVNDRLFKMDVVIFRWMMSSKIGTKTPLSPDAFARLKICKNAFAAGALPRTPFGELTALPKPLAGFGGLFAAGMGR